MLAVLCSLAFLTYLDRICIMRVQGEIERDLGFSKLRPADEQQLRETGKESDPQAREKMARDRATQRMSWVFSAFLLGYLLFEIPGGWMGDRWGPRWVIVRIVIWWSIFTALTGSVVVIGHWLNRTATVTLLFGLMVAARFFFGLGEAGAFPNIARALGRWFPSGDRALAQGTIWMSSRLGGAVAPALIGALAGWAGWQRAFWVLGLVGVIWAIFFARWFRDRPEEMPGVNQAERELIRAKTGGEDSIYDDAEGTLAHAPVPWARLVSSFSLLALYVVSFSMSFCWYFFVTFLPKYFKEQHGIDYAQSEIVSGLPLLAGAVACLAGGRLSDWLVTKLGSRRWGRNLPGIIGCAMAACCALSATQLRSPWACILLICLAAASQDFSLPCMWSVPIDVGGRHAGTVGGCMNSMGCIGGMLSPLVAAKLSSAFGWASVFFAFAAIYLLAALAWACVDASCGLEEAKRKL